MSGNSRHTVFNSTHMQSLRQQIGREEFDYPALTSSLSGYANPRDRITTLLRRGDIVRVKMGLYVFGDGLRRRPYSREVLANLIYGPSFISLDSALSFHGLIPERVDAVTSVTTKRPKAFATPVGSFFYRRAPRAYFHLGMDRVEEGDVAFLIAVPERALADKIRDDRGHSLRNEADAARYLFEDLRIDRSDFARLNPAFLKANTRELLLVIDASADVAAAIHGEQRIKIKIEVDTDPPPGFTTETKFLLQPIPFSVRAYSPSSLFSGKMHAVLCRGWQSRVKGRDWYDFVWYVGRGTELDLAHLEARMRQSGHYDDTAPLDEQAFRRILARRISDLDVGDARSDVERFLPDPSVLGIWSREFFTAVAKKISIQRR